MGHHQHRGREVSNHYEWTTAPGALYLLTTRHQALEDLGVEGVEPANDDEVLEGVVTAPYVLFVGTENGDGTLIEGELADITGYVDHLHTYIHRINEEIEHNQ